jgi:hypothetical protein
LTFRAQRGERKHLKMGTWASPFGLAKSQKLKAKSVPAES